MHRLWPSPTGDDVPDAKVGAELAALERPQPGTRPWVATNMVTSLDGASSRSGRSGGLGGDGDRRMFHLVRRLPDVVLVGAGTVRAERYGPITEPNADGIVPRLAIVTAQLDLEPDLPCLTDPARRPLILTGDAADPRRREVLQAVADVVSVGATTEPSALLSVLARGGHRVVLCEGGPTLLGQFVDADLVDEWFVTVAAVAVAGSERRITAGAPEVDRRLRLRTIFAEGSDLFLSHVRADLAGG